MPLGVGGLVSNLMFPGLDDRLAQHITPNPNPLAQQGGPAAPGSVDQLGNASPSGPPPGSNLAPPAVTQPDPVNSAYARDLISASRRDQMAQGVNQGLDSIAAGFGTAQQQASKQAAIRGGSVGNSLGDLVNIQAMQDQTIKDNEHARFMGNAAVFAQSMSAALGRPVSVAEATEWMNNPDTLKMATGAAGANMQTTGTQKDAEAATKAYADAHPEATAKDIADYKANLIAGGMGGSDLNQRQYLQERSAAIAAGQKDFPDFATWQATHAADAAAQKKTADDATEFKDSAFNDYQTVKSKTEALKPYIETLAKDPGAAQEALRTPWPTTGATGYWDPAVHQNVKDAAIALEKVRSSLKGEQLSNVKNVRNQQEFGILGQAAVGGLDAAASPADFAKAIDILKSRYLDVQATSELAVGHKLTGPLVGHGNRDLLLPTLSSGKKNPFYNGGTEELNQLSKDERDQARTLIARDGRDAVISHLTSQGYDTTGL